MTTVSAVGAADSNVAGPYLRGATPTATRCAICSVFTVKGRTDKQKELGFYPCPKASKHTVHINPRVEHDCKSFSQVPPEQMEARIKWEKQV